MPIRSRLQLKAWFRKKAYPTESQFADWLDSYFHKEDDTIPINSVASLTDRLNEKYSIADAQNMAEKTGQQFDQMRAAIEELSVSGSYNEIARLDNEMKQIIGIDDTQTDIFSVAGVRPGYIDAAGNIITA